MKNMNMFTIITFIPKGSNIVSSKWVFKYKKVTLSKGNSD